MKDMPVQITKQDNINKIRIIENAIKPIYTKYSMIPEYGDLGYIASSSCTSYSSDDDSSINSNFNYTLLQDKYDVQTLHRIKSNKDYNCLTSFLDLPPLKNVSN